MDANRQQRLWDLFDQAVSLPTSQRTGFVRGACDDPDLAREVLAMVGEDKRQDSVIDRGLAEAARDLLEPDGAPPPPARVKSYTVEGLLGEGGMGAVYRARRDDLKSVVAIKFLKGGAISPELRERFRREQQFLAQLKHPAIAHLLDADALPDGTLLEGVVDLAFREPRGWTVVDLKTDGVQPQYLAQIRLYCDAIEAATGQKAEAALLSV